MKWGEINSDARFTFNSLLLWELVAECECFNFKLVMRKRHWDRPIEPQYLQKYFSFGRTLVSLIGDDCTAQVRVRVRIERPKFMLAGQIE